MTLTTHSPEETLALGRLIGRLAAGLPGVVCITLEGPLGAGKTHLTHGIAQGAGVHDPTLVSSPTYVLLNVYPGAKTVYHVDAYRVNSGADLAATGIEEILRGEGEAGIVVIEWPSRIADILPAERLAIALEHGETSDERTATPVGVGKKGEHMLAAIESQLKMNLG